MGGPEGEFSGDWSMPREELWEREGTAKQAYELGRSPSGGPT